MRIIRFSTASAFLSFLVAALLLAVNCGDDDDNDDSSSTTDDASETDDTEDDTSADDASDDTGDDDTTASWADRCGTLVDAIYDECGEGLFDLSRDAALAACVDEMMGIPWECVVDCWETYADCTLWYECVTDDCGISPPDDDTTDDTTD